MPRSPLVSAEVLRALLGEVTVLDIRYRTGVTDGREEHRRGHVPGAVYVDLDADLAGPAGGAGRHPLPDPAAFSAAMRRAGVCEARPVVVYDDWSGRAAARAWWLLRHCGHEDVRVLDGGWPAWVAAGGAVETGDGVAARTGDFQSRPGSTPSVDVSAVPSIAVLVDARAPARYRGEHEPVDARAGHVPGAVNVPTEANLRPDGTFRTPDELAAAYAAVGAVTGADVAVYCGSGVTAAHDVLALQIVGVPAALWAGSWSQWIADPSRPVAVGSQGPSDTP